MQVKDHMGEIGQGFDSLELLELLPSDLGCKAVVLWVYENR